LPNQSLTNIHYVYTLKSVQFEWDERKRRKNIQKHGIDFLDAPEIFQGPMLVSLDEKHDYGEDRFVGIGFLRNKAVVVIFTEQDIETIRLISVRKATKHEEDRFKETLPD
jgi:uncharacterized protein